MSTTRVATLRAFRLTAIAAGLSMLTGCNPIGGGTGPVRLVVNGPDGTADADTGNVYRCLRSGLTATLFFENGTASDVTQRVTWSLDNPADASFLNVSTFTREGATRVAGGVLTPVSPTSGEQRVRVRATFSEFSDAIDIAVRPVPNMVMEQRDIGTGLQRGLALVTPLADGEAAPVTHLGEGMPAPVTRQRMGPRTTIDLSITADLDGVPTRIDPAASWTFDAPPAEATTPNAGIAVISSAPDSAGLITTVAANERPLVARASFDTCGQSLATEIRVAPIQSLAVVPEFGGQPLIAPNTERYYALADFGDGPEQDISATTIYTSSATGTAAFLSALIGLPNLLSSIAANTTPVTITATTPDPDPNSDTVGPVVGTTTQTIVADTLVPATTMNAIRIEPQNPQVIAGSALVCPLRVIGLFAGGAEQDITRRTSFTSGTPAVAQVSSVPQTAGQVSVNSRLPGTSTITGTVQVGTTVYTATTTYTLVAPGAPRPTGGFCGETLPPLPVDALP